MKSASSVKVIENPSATDAPLKPYSKFIAGLCFGSFLTLWSCLAFKMGQAPFMPGVILSGC